MASPVMELRNLIEDIKTKITDAQYIKMLEQLREIHNNYTSRLPAGFRLSTPVKVSKLAYSVVRSGVTNPGQLAHILKKKGFACENYLHESFKEWMNDIGIQVHNNTVTIQ